MTDNSVILNVNGLGEIYIRKNINGNMTTDLAEEGILQGSIYTIEYDGTYFNETTIPPSSALNKTSILRVDLSDNIAEDFTTYDEYVTAASNENNAPNGRDYMKIVYDRCNKLI